jgi:hypothetical protein
MIQADTVHLDQTFIETVIEAGRYENCIFDGCVCEGGEFFCCSFVGSTIKGGSYEAVALMACNVFGYTMRTNTSHPGSSDLVQEAPTGSAELR